jgi:flagellar protein FliS
MTQPGPGKAASRYQAVGASTGIMDASPHRLVQMLMEGALDKLATAKGCIERGDLEGKSRHVTWGISIVNGLRASLDLETGGSIAANLNDLYGYMTKRLFEATTSDDPEIVNEVINLLLEIKSAWDAMPDDVKHAAAGSEQATGT